MANGYFLIHLYIMTAVHGRHEAAGFFQLASAGRNIPFPSQLEGLHKVLVNLMYSKISIIC